MCMCVYKEHQLIFNYQILLTKISIAGFREKKLRKKLIS